MLYELKEFRLQRGYSQEKMALEIGTSLSMYEKVEQGKAQPSRGFMQKVKRRFTDANIDTIFFAKDQQ